MSEQSMVCPNCGGQVPDTTTICPVCQEDLASLIRIENEHIIHYNSALALAHEDKLNQAQAELALSLRLKPEFLPSLVLYAKVCARQHLWSEAQASITQAHKLNPSDAAVAQLAESIRHEVGRVEVQTLKVEESARLARRASAEKTLAMYQRDLITAFAAGAGLIAFISMLFSGFRGRRR